MKLEQQQQAQQLYFQTDLSKTQIAEAIGVTRRSVHNWIRENNWEYLRRCSAAMPSLIVANCYQAMAQLSESILSPARAGEPITRIEVESMYKLSLIVSKLKTRIILSERMETFTGFMDGLQEIAPDLAKTIAPYISQYIAACANINAPATVNARVGRPAPPPPTDPTEAELDQQDIEAWAAERAAVQQVKASTTTRPQPAPATPAPQKPPKADLRKQLRGTASTGPGKAFAHTIAA